ncbi:hypothetical protein [Snodgrassella communis]|uniref:Uncharacterized protein n=1 Tax=Snodgrassella alvi TaxID=1196083 RepID=A0A2N9XPC2_9NEIS|nr:hypothetical protein [Snodgrassella communis]PIT50177.1 hypothetical protein BHC48_07165 [Snodgrassella communis]
MTDDDMQTVLNDIYTVTKHRLNSNDPLVKVLYFSLSIIQDEHQYIFSDILKAIEKDCPEYAQLDNERLSMLPDILHLQIKRKRVLNSTLYRHGKYTREYELLILLAGCILPPLYIFTALIVIVTIIYKFVLNTIL